MLAIGLVTLLLALVTNPIAPPSEAPIGDPLVAHPAAQAALNRGLPDAGYSPAQVRHAYGLDQLPLDGSGQVIAIVTAYHNPTVAHDVDRFANVYHLPRTFGDSAATGCTVWRGPHPCFQQLSSQPSTEYQDSWGADSALEVEWSHAMAPGADILLVEADEPTLPALLDAVDRAVTAGAHVVSMSWGVREFAGETADDGHFQRDGVTFLAAAGEWTGGVMYPAVSPEVVSIGGTTLRLDSDGNILSEIAWPGTAQGASAYEPLPDYQRAYLGPGAPAGRQVPDVAYAGDPRYGFPVLDSALAHDQTNWIRLGGTSAGAPQWAAVVSLVNEARGDQRHLGSHQVLGELYRTAIRRATAPLLRPISMGSEANCESCALSEINQPLGVGIGSPIANRLVPRLAAAGPPA